jgi:hypothetical protein
MILLSIWAIGFEEEKPPRAAKEHIVINRELDPFPLTERTEFTGGIPKL